MRNLDTGELMKLVQSGAALEDVMVKGEESMNAPSLKEYLNALCREKGLTIPGLMVTAGLSKSFTYQLFEGKRSAGRNVILRLSFAFQLSVEETQRLLTISGNNILYPRVRRDAVLIYALEKKKSLEQAELLLEEKGEKSLCGGRQNE